MDILEVGCDTDPLATGFGLNPAETVAHFALWAIMKACVSFGPGSCVCGYGCVVHPAPPYRAR